MDGPVSSDDLLDILGDTEGRALLTALRREPQSAKELASTTDLSLPTVYRRLDKLTTRGLVDSTTEVEADGTHYQRYECSFDEAVITLTTDGFSTELSRDGEAIDSGDVGGQSN